MADQSDQSSQAVGSEEPVPQQPTASPAYQAQQPHERQHEVSHLTIHPPGEEVREARWPASLAVIATLLLYVTLPERLTFGPTWLVPTLEFALLLPLSITVPHRHSEELPSQRATSVALIAVLNIANIASLVLLIKSLLEGSKSSGVELIMSAVQVWLTNVIIFGLWYWELDRGGPGKRSHPAKRSPHPDFLFPQMTMRGAAPAEWRPLFMDYLFISFTNATAFSPTDTMPLTRWAKTLMMVQAMTSLLTVAVVAGRAINILS